jgi:toxin ParE1/3/4
MSQVRQSALARADLIQIWVDVALDSQAAADRVYDRLEARVKILERFPEAGMARPDIAKDARILVESPYLILYRLVSEGVQIVRVLHGARDIDDSLFSEGIE